MGIWAWDNAIISTKITEKSIFGMGTADMAGKTADGYSALPCLFLQVLV